MRRRAIVHKMLPEQRHGELRTICEVQRQTHRLVTRRVMPSDPETAKLLHALLEEAYDLGKRMSVKMLSYKAEWEREVFEKKQTGDDALPDETVAA